MTIVAALCLALSVHDGDTIRCGSERIRLEGIDAPELAGSERCSPRRVKALASSANPSWCDTRKGLAARDELEAFLERGSVRIDRRGVDRYGRTLARVTMNGRDAGEHLVDLGLARPWR